MKSFIKFMKVSMFALLLTLIITCQIVSGQEIDSTLTVKNESFKKEKSSNSKFKKGTFFLGGNLSLNDTEGFNDYIVANVDLLDVNKTGLIMSYVAGYFISPVASVGIRGTYKYARNEQLLEADFLNLSFNATTYQTQVLSTGFELHTFLRNYIPFGEKGNFFAFSETSVYFIKNNNYQRATRNPGNTDESISTIMAVSNGIGAGTSFGVSYFNSKHLAFEFQLGTTGLEIIWKDIEKDLVDEGRSRKVTFKNGLNLLRFQVGVTYYLKNGFNFKVQK